MNCLNNIKENKVSMFPFLRFPEFTDEWGKSVLSDFMGNELKIKTIFAELPL